MTCLLSFFLPEVYAVDASLPEEDPNFRVPPMDGKCRALALQGGGTKGAYEVGALKAMTDLMKPLEYAYDIIVGVSCGGINAGLLAQYNRGFEVIAIDFLWNMWANLPITDLWEHWTLGPLEALWRGAFINNQKMVDLFESLYNGREIKRGLALQSVDMDTGEIVMFDETMDKEFLGTAVVASASIPALFRPVYVDKKTLVDGLVLSDLDLSEAITKCQEKGYKDEDIIVDVILCFKTVTRWDIWSKNDAFYKNAYDIYQRKKYFLEFYGIYEDITRVVRGYPNVHFRHLITPLRDLGGGTIPLWDGIDVTQRFLQQGYDDGKISIEWYYEWLKRHHNQNYVRSSRADAEAYDEMPHPNSKIPITFADIRE